MKLNLLIILLVLFSTSYSQDFERLENTLLNQKTVRFYDRNAGILIQKTWTNVGDSSIIEFALGLVVFKRSRSSDDFMNENAFILFEDQSIFKVDGKISINYFQEGKHQFSVKYILGESELNLLRSKTIQKICVAGECNSLDKWQGPKVLKAFQVIDKEPFK